MHFYQNKFPLYFAFIIALFSSTGFSAAKKSCLNISYDEAINLIKEVNYKWQNGHSYKTRAFWDNAAYHTGNIEAFKLTKTEDFRKYSEDWADYNGWKGATSDDTASWVYSSYGETSDHVLFGDWQACFQTYIDLYNLDSIKDEKKIARVKSVMGYQISTPNNDYVWWSDGFYMVFPVLVKMYKLTGDTSYLIKLKNYFSFSDNLMYDGEYGLYYRDAKYIYPKQPTINGRKNFWSRGNGWVFAAFVKVLEDMPESDPLRPIITERFKGMALTLKATQQKEGYWTRSIIDPEHAPGMETSGTAFFTYGLFWGINNGILDEKTYIPTAARAWNYLMKEALQKDFTVGYVQPIGENPSPTTEVSARSTSNFGTGAWLLAACEVARFLKK